MMASRTTPGAGVKRKTRATKPRVAGSRAQKVRTARILELLDRAYPAAECALVHQNAYELLVATILSAQCTDARVNLVTPELFARFPTVQALANAEPAELESLIRTTGFFRNKTKSLIGMARAVMDRHEGQIPADLDALVALPGVGRKTAQVVLGTVFGLATGIVVDTHVKRLARRLGLTPQTDPAKVERDLMAVIPRDHWINLAHQLIHHGRRICLARRPRCEECALREPCPKVGVTAPKTKRSS
jgi:endonuclease-3